MIEKQVSKGIIRTYFEKMEKCLELDVAIVGGGPSGIAAAYYMAKAGLRVALFDRKLSPGGGMWGGAMMFNQLVIQEEALGILKDFDISYESYEDGLYTADSIESTSALLYKAVHAGATIFNCYSVEDVVFKNNVVSGVVVNWTPVLREGLHVDPLNIMAKFVIDGTGHDSEMCKVVARKNGIKLETTTGEVIGERSLDVAEGERQVVEGTKEIYPGLYVCGMASSAVGGTPRMGPMYIPGSEELVIFICSFIGALIGFLWYNAFPAQVFMGDTGSLTIGGIIAVFAIIIHKELLIPILCGIFLVENLSVILQVRYFKSGKKKGHLQRVFKRAPIHDHFRTTLAQLDPNCSYLFMKPNSVFHESKITVRFWIVTIVLAAITIITLKIR